MATLDPGLGIEPVSRPGEVDQAPRDEGGPRVVLSFDVEEHHRIEAAAGLTIDPSLKTRYAERVGTTTRRLLEGLDARKVKATFFVVGELAQADPGLIRDIQGAGHEIASHGWDHRRVLAMSPDEFRDDLRRSVDVLRQITGEPVLGYRAPTFSIVRRTAWALDVLAEEGLLYDSSIFPVRHDRYGVPDAPRGPFLARCERREILELPPLTLRFFGRENLPIGGGGYFRLFPLAMLETALRRLAREIRPPVAMLYFHPWEFDPEQPRLPLRGLNRFRTYVGLRRSRHRLASLLLGHRFTRADAVARRWSGPDADLPRFSLGGTTASRTGSPDPRSDSEDAGRTE